MGVYLAVGETAAIRKTVYGDINSHILEGAQERGEAVIMAGDWNAVLQATDRPSGRITPLNKSHIAFVQGASLEHAGGCREATHQGGGRIDDVYFRPGSERVGGRGKHQQRVRHDIPGLTFDHYPLHVKLDAAALGIALPQPTVKPKPETRTTIRVPIRKEDVLRLQKETCVTLGPRILQAGAALARALDDDILPFREGARGSDWKEVHKPEEIGGRPAREVALELGRQVVQIVTKVDNLARSTLPTVTRTHGGRHYRPRQAQKKRIGLISKSKLLRQLCLIDLARGTEADRFQSQQQCARH